MALHSFKLKLCSVKCIVHCYTCKYHNGSKSQGEETTVFPLEVAGQRFFVDAGGPQRACHHKKEEKSHAQRDGQQTQQAHCEHQAQHSKDCQEDIEGKVAAWRISEIKSTDLNTGLVTYQSKLFLSKAHSVIPFLLEPNLTCGQEHLGDPKRDGKQGGSHTEALLPGILTSPHHYEALGENLLTF